MRRSTNFACAVVAATALLLPAHLAAQTPPTDPQQPPTTQPPPQPTQPQQSTTAGEQAARQHLTNARNTLSEMTQLPAASQLTGDARTQVSELIANFNDLISAQNDWKASYDKVAANLTLLIGPENAEPIPPAAASGTPGAVGTSGVVDLDPAIREKLVELRRELSQFEKAAGATGATSPDNPAMTAPASPTTPYPSTPPSTAAPTGTPETTPAAGTSTSQSPAGNAEIMRHIAAIETLLKSEDDSGGITLTKMQLDQLRTHWAALKSAIR